MKEIKMILDDINSENISELLLEYTGTYSPDIITIKMNMNNDIEIIYNLYNSIDFNDISSEQTNINICINLLYKASKLLAKIKEDPYNDKLSITEIDKIVRATGKDINEVLNFLD